MKALMRGLSLGLVMVFCLVLIGCGTDNETEAQKLQKAQGQMPTPVNKGPATTAPPATSQTQRGAPSPTGGTEYKEKGK